MSSKFALRMWLNNKASGLCSTMEITSEQLVVNGANQSNGVMLKAPPTPVRLSERIWITRKCRIESECRLNRNATISSLLITYYSVISIVYAVIDIKNTQADYSFQLLIAAIITLAASIYVPSMRFKERASDFKKCYVRLYGLWEQARKAEEEDNEKDVDQLKQRYQELIDESENHSPFDYYAVKFEQGGRDSSLALTRQEKAKFYLYKLIRWLLLAAFSLGPILVLYFLF